MQPTADRGGSFDLRDSAGSAKSKRAVAPTYRAHASTRVCSHPHEAMGPVLAARAVAPNWMRASPPGIAFRFPKAESSPVGGGATRTKRRKGLKWAAAACFILGLALAGNSFFIHAKALAAQVLLHRAWSATQATGAAAKPWPWADTTPIARLFAPAQDVDLFVLAGATGRTLAFGPGHHDGSAMPGRPGNVVLSAHRDTHFRFLRQLAIGDALIVELPAGQRFHYRVRETQITDQRDLRLPRLPTEPTLTLVTCYPFGAVETGGTQRYVVVATADGGTL
jgi:sortase A